MLQTNKSEKVMVDKDILDFLKATYFGTYSDPLKAASSRAYRDMNRTIRFNGFDSKERIKLREKVNDVFEEELKRLSSKSIKCQKDFDFWHRSISEKIIKLYINKGVRLTYGHTQKWINMTIKYLYMLEAESFNGVFQFLHIPLDNHVFDIAQNSLGIERPKLAWSTWNDYDNQYLRYQKLMRENIKDCEPLRWEFTNWLVAARNISN